MPCENCRRIHLEHSYQAAYINIVGKCEICQPVINMHQLFDILDLFDSWQEQPDPHYSEL